MNFNHLISSLLYDKIVENISLHLTSNCGPVRSLAAYIEAAKFDYQEIKTVSIDDLIKQDLVDRVGKLTINELSMICEELVINDSMIVSL
jgi:arsenate reductase-like glutaredoxin family protein